MIWDHAGNWPDLNKQKNKQSHMGSESNLGHIPLRCEGKHKILLFIDEKKNEATVTPQVLFNFVWQSCSLHILCFQRKQKNFVLGPIPG